MRRISVFIWCILLLLGSITVTANEGAKKDIDYNDPEFQATVNMLSMDGHGKDDYATCSVKQMYYKDVAAMFKKGMTKQQILDYYVKELGVHALQIPPKKGFYLSLWVIPFLLLFIISFLMYFIIKKWKKNNIVSIAEKRSFVKGNEVDDIYLALIEEERKRLI